MLSGKIAIISDVHANLWALRAVLAHPKMNDPSISFKISLGDKVGYYTEPNECIALLRAQQFHCLAGNHDLAALNLSLAASYFNPRALEAVTWTAGELNADSKAFLSGLSSYHSETLQNGEIVEFVHGSLEDHANDYILFRPEAVRNLGLMQGKRCFFGHTHSPRLIFQDSYGDVFLSPLLGTTTKALMPDLKYLINPGSVGQPRDRNPLASFAIFDQDKNYLEIFRVDYDVAAAQRDILNSGLDQKAAASLAKRLVLGL